MADVLLNLVVSTIDRATAGLNKVIGSIARVTAAAEQSVGAQTGLSNAIASGMIKADLAVSAVTNGYQKLQGMIAESSNLQLSNMSTAQSFAALTGESFDTAAGFVDRLNASLAKSAAALPGATSDYTSLARTIQDNFIPAFQDASGKLDMKRFEASLTSVTEAYGVLSAASNTPVMGTAMGLSRFLSGASIAEIRNFEAFQNNPQIANFYEEELKKLGGDNKKISIQQRLDIVQRAGEKFITEDFKGRAAETVDGLFQSFKSSLFDPNSGVFGFSKDLDLNKDGVQSAFTAFNRLLVPLIGPTGIFTVAGEILQKLGLTLDPMRVLRDSFDWLYKYVYQINVGLIYIRTRLQRQSPAQLLSQFRGFSAIVDLLTTRINATLTRVREAIDRITPQQFFEAGATLGTFIGEAITRLVQFLGQVDYGEVLGILSDVFVRAFNFLAGVATGVLAKLDLKEIAFSVIRAIPGLIGAVFSFIGDTIVNLDGRVYAAIAGGLLATVLLQSLTVYFSTLAAKMGLSLLAQAAIVLIPKFLAAFAAATAGLPLLLVAAAGLAIGAFAKVVIDRWSEIGPRLAQFFENIGTNLLGTLQVIWGIITLDGNMIKAGVQNFTSGLQGLIDQVNDTIAIATGGKTSGEIRAEQVAQQAENRFQAAAAANRTGGNQSIAPARNGEIPLPTNPPQVILPPIEAKYKGGYIPTAASGFLGALATEMMNMPRGASPIIANTSEAILRPEQLQRLVSGSVAAGATSGGMTFAPNITVNGGGGNAQEIAQQVLAVMEDLFAEFRSQQLA